MLNAQRSGFVAAGIFAAFVSAGCNRANTDDKAVKTDTPAGSSTAPAANAADERDRALVRIVHAVPAAPAIDVLADQNTVASNVRYKTATPYKEVPADQDDFVVRAGDKTLAQNSESIMSGRHYTLIVLPANRMATDATGREKVRASDASEQPAHLQVVNDNLEMPPEGKARVRVIHASPDVETVDIFAQASDKPLFDDIDFNEISGYENVDPTVGKLELKANDGKQVVARPDVKLEAGKNYTIVVTGRAEGTPALSALVIEDEFMPQRVTE
jgi:Domain of unknown function (DUF4397)